MHIKHVRFQMDCVSMRSPLWILSATENVLGSDANRLSQAHGCWVVTDLFLGKLAEHIYSYLNAWGHTGRETQADRCAHLNRAFVYVKFGFPPQNLKWNTWAAHLQIWKWFQAVMWSLLIIYTRRRTVLIRWQRYMYLGWSAQVHFTFLLQAALVSKSPA